MRWLLLSPIVQSMTVFELWDDDAFHALATRAVRLARDTGALAVLPVALVYRSGVHVFAGEFAAAVGADRGGGRDRGRHRQPAASCTRGSSLGAWRGVEAEAHGADQRRPRERERARRGRVLAMAGYATAVLNNGLGRYEAAVDGARRGSDDGDWGYAGASLPELVEAAPVPAGRRSPPPRWPGWRSARAPRARTGRSASWRARGRC